MATQKPHVVILPIPILGRTNPMLQFSKRLSSKGIKVTLATTAAFAAKLSTSSHLSESSPFLSIAAITENSDQTPATIDDLIAGFADAVPSGLTNLVNEQEAAGTPVRCLVYDSSFPWALELARGFGIYAAPFFTQPFTVSMIFYHAYTGELATPVPVDAKVVSLPGLPEMEVEDLPTLVRVLGQNPLVEKIALNQFLNFHEADWQFFNTIDALETEVINWMLKMWPNVKAIGPAIPSMYVDKRLENDKDYGLNIFNPETATCMQWLDTQEAASTIYVSFGSQLGLGGDQMAEMAAALKSTGKPFLWVVKAGEEENLPSELRKEMSKIGMIISWAPQLAVLEHRAVGCFFTHCGWNSTLEALCMGVPLVAMPFWADQPTNAKLVEDVWRVGVRVKKDKKGKVAGEEIARCIREVMEGGKGEEVRSNALKLKSVARKAMEEGGSSDRNIEEFVLKISSQKSDH